VSFGLCGFCGCTQGAHVGTNAAATLPPGAIQAAMSFMTLTVNMLASHSAAFVVVMVDFSRLGVMMGNMMLPMMHDLAAMGMLRAPAVLAAFAFSLGDDIRFSRVIQLRAFTLTIDLAAAFVVVVMHHRSFFVVVRNVVFAAVHTDFSCLQPSSTEHVNVLVCAG